MDKRQHKRIIPDINIWSYIVGSLVDYPGNPAITLFTKGCNMSCGYCHNLKAMAIAPTYSPEYVTSLLNTVPLVNALVLTGGEPCLQKDLFKFLVYIKENFNFKIKLDTNGTMPDQLAKLLVFNNKLIDYIAMDIKCDFARYHNLGYKEDYMLLWKSVELIRNSGIDYQFRCTDYNLTDGDKKFIAQHFPTIKMQKFVKSS